MRPGTLHDLPGVYRVCRLTGAGRCRRQPPSLRPRPARARLGRPLPGLPGRRHPRHPRRAGGGRLLPRRPRHRGLRGLGRRGVAAPPLRERHPLRRGATAADAALSSACTTPPARMPGCSPRTRPTCTSTCSPGSRDRAGVDASWRDVLEGLRGRCAGRPPRGRPRQPGRPGLLRADRLHRARRGRRGPGSTAPTWGQGR